jgi:PhoH-like ATPase
MQKTYVLDTSAILADPDVITSLQDNEVVIPLAVLVELDRHKEESNTERGQKARRAIRILDGLRQLGDADVGVPTEGGGTLRFYIETPTELEGLDNSKTDAQIVGVAYELNAIVISNDLALCVIASAFGVQAEGYRAKNVEFDDNRYAVQDVYVSKQDMSTLVSEGFLNWGFFEQEPLLNQGLIVRNSSDPAGATILGRYVGDNQIKHINTKAIEKKCGAYAVPRNADQWVAMDLLMDPSIQLVNMVGIAGGGKTFITLAAGCLQVVEGGKGAPYKTLAITKSVVAFGGQELGFLPGTSGEKMAPVVANLMDHLNNLLNKETQMFMDKGQILIEPLAFIRGKSLDNMFLVVDEAQNLSEEDLLTILTRAGTNTKIILTGDPTQCDAPYLNAYNNGLMRVVKAFENQKIAGTVILYDSQRQELAKLAARLLGKSNNFWTRDK